jgi:2-hydroxy-6-oxonona-2,4-dienedioate hydrolase
MAGIKGRRTKAVDDPNWENIKAVFEPLIFDERHRIPDMVAVRQKTYAQPGMKQAMDHILCLQDPEIRTRNLIAEDDWRRIKAPTLIAICPDDSESFYQSSLRAAQLIPQARTFEVKKVRHWPYLERPDVFNPISVAFLRSL